MKGWEEDITGCRTFEELPREARDYVHYFEEVLETPVSWIGVGPSREEIIQKL